MKKPIIQVGRHKDTHSGFQWNTWTLYAFGKEFYLDQDEKFCQRVLGMTGREVAEEIGSNDLGNEETRQQLAEFILDRLEIDENAARDLKEWSLSPV